MKTIVFATNNPNKAAEVSSMLGGSYEVKTLKEIGCFEDIPETSDTLEGNAYIKSNHVKTHYKMDCFADDTGLEVEALEGQPGVRSARFAGEDNDSEKNMALLLEKLGDNDQRQAQFRTVISLIMDGQEYQFEGIAKGQITRQHSGHQGFGYDPIFQPEGYDRTFAEMTVEEKNAISHRGKAVRKLIDFLKKMQG